MHSLVYTTDPDLYFALLWGVTYIILYAISYIIISSAFWISSSLASHSQLFGGLSEALRQRANAALARRNYRAILVALVVFNFFITILIAINAPLDTGFSEKELDEFNLKGGAGDPVNYQFEPYPGYFAAVMPKHIHHLLTPESRFNSNKYIVLFWAILNGVVNALEERLADNSALDHPDDYVNYFLSPKLLARFPRLAHDHQWKEEAFFASQWIRGINPLTIERIREPQLPSFLDLRASDIAYLNEHVLLGGETFERLLEHRQLFLSDLRILNSVHIIIFIGTNRSRTLTYFLSSGPRVEGLRAIRACDRLLRVPHLHPPPSPSPLHPA